MNGDKKKSPTPLGKHLFLVGFMGSGKSTVGKKLAQSLDRPFMDLDETIEGQQGKTILEIFSQQGEPYFRELEKNLLASLAHHPPLVIALGGGTFRPDTQALIEEKGFSIWLQCSLTVIQERLGKTDDNRPLWKHDLKELFLARKPWYQKAHIAVNGESSTQEVINSILPSLAKV